MLANKTVSINVDLGEVEDAIRQAAEVIPWVDSVNVALGGHAGSPEVAREICALANPAGVAVHLHPGYPDRSGFGRRHMEMPRDELLYSLSQQRDVLPDIKVCKFHGALYNGADQDAALAATLLD
ncbi:MAG: LamB/YcsF family protein, partial [Planctomycetota bacterium]